MKNNFNNPLVNLIIILITIVYSVRADESIIANVFTHQYNGTKISVEGKEINMFLGISYAEPPIGDLRFKPSSPLKFSKERKTFDATKWPNNCYQEGVNPLVYQNQDVSEDCLYLNIWAPSNTTQTKPVMVFIHGGAFVEGASSVLIYDGRMMASKDVVVVTINYRLNAFGFLYTGTDDAPGNAGLWDQFLALKWVNDNIRYFGGNSEEITIIGQSAGSISVSVHLLSPITRNLFRNAIMMSGSVLMHSGGENPEVVKKMWLNAAKLAGCGKGKTFTSNDIQCLKNTPAHKLVAAANARNLTSDLSEYLSSIVYGDQFLPKRPIEMLRSGSFKENVRLLIGTTDDEGTWLLPSKVDPIKYSLANPANLTKSEAIRELANLANKMQSDILINGSQVAQLYFSRLPENDLNLLRRTIGVALGDFYFTCPSIEFAKLIYQRDPQRNRVYQYYFNAKMASDLGFCASWQGSCHATDLIPAFGFNLLYPELLADKPLEEVSIKLLNVFTHFAKNGSPPLQEGIGWPSFYLIRDQIIAHYYEFSKTIKPEGNFGIDVKNTECEKLWKYYIDL